MVRFFFVILWSFKCFATAIISSPLTEISKGNYQFKILFLNETSRIPFVNFDVTNGYLVRRSHSRTIRGYELSFLLKKNNENAQMAIENIYWIKNGVRRPITNLKSGIKSSVSDVPPKRQRRKVISSDTKVLTEIDSDNFIYEKGIIIKYSILSKSNFLDYKISKFPQFTGFIKRFREISSRSKQVFIDGEYWYQNPLYLVEIFPIEGQSLGIIPMAVELKSYGSTRIIESEKFEPKFKKAFQGNVLYGKNGITLFPGEGNTYDADHPVSILVEISGNGLIENYEPDLSENLKKYLVDKTIENQSYGIPSAKKVINYRFSFPNEGTYSGSFLMKYYDEKTKSIHSENKEFSFDILPPKKSRKFSYLSKRIKESSFLKIQNLNLGLFLLIIFITLFKYIKVEFLILVEAIRFYRSLKLPNAKKYNMFFEKFYGKVDSEKYNFKSDLDKYFHDKYLGKKQSIGKVVLRNSEFNSNNGESLSRDQDLGFIIIYLFVRNTKA